MRKIAVLVLVGACLLAVAGAPALASEPGACSVKQARRDVARAQHKLDEARRVLAATRHYSAAYGTSVGRWVRLSRRVGWTWGQFPTLMLVIDRESGGDPHAQNPSSASGLLQLMSIHYAGRFNPLDPKRNLAYGLRLWHGSAWQAWAL